MDCQISFFSFSLLHLIHHQGVAAENTAFHFHEFEMVAHMKPHRCIQCESNHALPLVLTRSERFRHPDRLVSYGRVSQNNQSLSFFFICKKHDGAYFWMQKVGRVVHFGSGLE